MGRLGKRRPALRSGVLLVGILLQPCLWLFFAEPKDLRSFQFTAVLNVWDVWPFVLFFLLAGTDIFVGAEGPAPESLFVVMGAAPVAIHAWCVWAMFSSHSSTAAIVLVFCPIYEVLGTALFAWLYLILRARARTNGA